MGTTVQHLVYRAIGVVAAAVLLISVPEPARAQQEPQPGDAITVQTMSDEELGPYLTDAEGMSLYLFESDGEAQSTCYDECADAWPPLTTGGEPDAGEGVNADLLGTFTREDGATQVTYNGWPLYYYVQDYRPGDIEGQDIEDYGAEWYLISPEGEKVEAEEVSE